MARPARERVLAVSEEGAGQRAADREEAIASMNGLVRLPQSLGLRVVTGVVIGALVVAGVFTLGDSGVALAAGAVMLAAGWEWARLAGLRPLRARLAYLAALGAIGGLLGWLGGAAAWAVIAAAAVWWLAVTAWLVGGGQARAAGAGRAGVMALGLLLLPALMLGIYLLAASADAGRGILLYALCLVWAADIGAYFAGRAWGRRALAPQISAGKTWEGLAGGLAAVLAYALAGAWLLGVPAAGLMSWCGLALLAGAVSVAGDLFESMLKRAAGVKDSGALLPGHGGVLDRIDSLVAAIPIMALGLAALPFELLP